MFNCLNVFDNIEDMYNYWNSVNNSSAFCRMIYHRKLISILKKLIIFYYRIECDGVFDTLSRLNYWNRKSASWRGGSANPAVTASIFVLGERVVKFLIFGCLCDMFMSNCLKDRPKFIAKKELRIDKNIRSRDFHIRFTWDNPT